MQLLDTLNNVLQITQSNSAQKFRRKHPQAEIYTLLHKSIDAIKIVNLSINNLEC